MNDLEREFEEMVRANRSTIYTVCYMFSQDQDEVADLFQEVLINLWKSMPTFEGRSNVRSWIYRVSLNVCISLDHKKRRNRQSECVYLARSQETEKQDCSSNDGHQSLRRDGK